MNSRPTSIIATTFLLLSTTHFFGQTADVDTQVKEIAQHYNEIEAQIPQAVHYVKVLNNRRDNCIETSQGWLNEAGDTLKVSFEVKAAQSRKLTEMFFEPDISFVLERSENTLPDGSKTVSESRKYFGSIRTPGYDSDDALIRELDKNAIFKPGEPLDTVHVKNVPVKADYKEDNSKYQQNADDILESVEREQAVNDSSAKAAGDSAKYRLMRETSSPNGRYAMGWAPGDKEPIDWKKYADGMGGYGLDSDTGSSLNYLIDLQNHRIIGTTRCQFNGTRARYNHRENMVTWSTNDRYFVQATSWKWYSDGCAVGEVVNGKLVGARQIMPEIEKRAYGFLATRHNEAFKKHGKEFAITVASVSADNDGTIDLEVSGEIPKSTEEDSDFTVTERFRIMDSGKGITAAPIAVAFAPQTN